MNWLPVGCLSSKWVPLRRGSPASWWGGGSCDPYRPSSRWSLPMPGVWQRSPRPPRCWPPPLRDSRPDWGKDREAVLEVIRPNKNVCRLVGTVLKFEIYSISEVSSYAPECNFWKWSLQEIQDRGKIVGSFGNVDNFSDQEKWRNAIKIIKHH